MHRSPFWLTPAVAAILLAACFGGGDSAPRSTPPPPPPAATPTRPAPTAARLLPTPSPFPSPVALPQRPGRLADYAETIARFLSDLETPRGCPDELLDAWEIPISPPQRCAQADTNGDGRIELILVLTPPETAPEEPGALLDRPVTIAVLDQRAGQWSTAYQTPGVGVEGGFLTSTVEGGPEKVLLAVRDLNGLPGAEVAYRVDGCGAHTCYTTVEVVGWDGARYADLTAGDIAISFADVALEDRDGDGAFEIVLHGGSIGSIGAGPTRTRTEAYRWDGVAWSLAETAKDPSNFLYHAVLDADETFLGGDYEGALALYQSAMADTALDEWKEGERGEMFPYLLFRMALTYFALGGRTEEADLLLLLAGERFPDSLHGRMAAVFREAWLVEGNVSAGCTAALALVQENLDAFDEFWYFGYGNPPFDAQALCPL